MGGSSGQRRLVFDTSKFPLVIMRFHEAGCSDADVDHIFESYERLFVRGDRYAILIFAGGMRAAPSAEQRRRLTDWEDKHRMHAKRFNVGTGLVIDSALIRGAITAIRWVSPAPVPEKISPSPAEAARFCLERLAAEGVPFGPITAHVVHALESEGHGAP